MAFGHNMKWIIPVVLCLCFVEAVSAQEPKPGVILAPDKFDEWGGVSFVAESARLKKIALQAKEWPLSMIYLVIHSGQTACKDEAKARGIRAKNYLTKLEIAPERIVWIDGGWRKDVLVQVWIWPPELGQPKVQTDQNLKPGEVKIEKGCKIKQRRP